MHSIVLVSKLRKKRLCPFPSYVSFNNLLNRIKAAGFHSRAVSVWERSEIKMNICITSSLLNGDHVTLRALTSTASWRASFWGRNLCEHSLRRVVAKFCWANWLCGEIALLGLLSGECLAGCAVSRTTNCGCQKASWNHAWLKTILIPDPWRILLIHRRVAILFQLHS